MAQVINTNSLSLITQNNINKNQSALSSSIERLSSGLRINSAKDDALLHRPLKARCPKSTTTYSVSVN